MEARGEVRILWGDLEVTADRAIWSEPEGQLLLMEGTWTLEDGSALRFQSSSVQIDSKKIQVNGAVWRSDIHGMRVVSDQWVIEGSRLHGEGVTFETCPCPGPDPWSLVAQEVQLDLEKETIQLRKGHFRIADRRVVPLPRITVPTERHSGLLAPTLGSGTDGLQLEQPVYLTLGPSADTTWTPEWRQERGPRVQTDTRWMHRNGDGHARTATAWDTQHQRWRGAGSWSHSIGNRFSLASTGQWASDPRYLEDYGAEILERRTPWLEQRALVGWPALEFTGASAVQSGRPAPATWALSGYAHEWRGPGGWVVDGWTGAQVQTWPGSGTITSWNPISQAQLFNVIPVGPWRLTPRVTGGYRGADRGGFRPTLGGEVLLPLWRSKGTRFEQLLPTLGATWNPITGHHKVSFLPRWQLQWSPQSYLMLTGGPVASRKGLSGLGSGRWRHSKHQGWFHADTQKKIVAGGSKWEVGWVTLGLEGWASPGIRQVVPSAEVPLPWTQDSTRIGGAIRWDLEEKTPLSQEFHARYLHPTRCLSSRLFMRLDADQTLPIWGLALDLWPKAEPPSY